MGRWEPGAGERLERAALELFREQGFAATTVPQITARAGLTTRTFFRYFPDKREVLFAGEDEIPQRVADVMAEAPAELDPMEVIDYALTRIAERFFEGAFDYLRARQSVIDADEGLRERETSKFTVIAAAGRDGFRRRGVDELTSTLAAEVAVTALRVAILRWLSEPRARRLAEVVTETLGALQALAAPSR